MELNIPESIQQFKLDWEKYIPPGGNGFAELYNTGFKQVLTDAKAMCMEARAKGALVSSQINTLTAQMQTINDFFALHERTFNDEDITPVKMMMGAFMKNLEGKIEKLRKDVPPESVVTADITFLDDINRFIALDQEVDMLLYALGQIPNKFRVKLFREIARKAQVIEGLINVLETNRSQVAEAIFQKVGNFFNEAKEPYKRLLPAIRKGKKRIDKGDVSFLYSDINPDMFYGKGVR